MDAGTERRVEYQESGANAVIHLGDSLLCPNLSNLNRNYNIRTYLKNIPNSKLPTILKIRILEYE